MANLSKQKVKMPEQLPQERARNFGEVALGYTAEMAMEEAARCIDCKNRPCVAGCPVAVQIPEFIGKMKVGDFEAAYDIIRQTNSLPAVCGRVCPQETQCEALCTRGRAGESVAIGRLERFAADEHMRTSAGFETASPPEGRKVAVVGAGPAGLTCAGDLAKLGYCVVVFEAFHIPGGVLMYGIPEFRLPKDIVRREIAQLEALGVEIRVDMVIGKVLTVDDLLEEGFEAIFVGTGAGLPSFMGIPGEGLVGVYSANEFLTRVNLMKAYDKDYDTPILHIGRVAVIGGGNVTMDAARCARRFGTEKVYIVYRRSEEEMPARLEEVHHAKEEGIEFITLTNPVAINGDDQGRVKGVTCIRMVLGEPDASGRRSPHPVPGSEFELDVDAVIMAIGNSPNPLIRMTTDGLEATKRGCLVVNEDTLETTRAGVFAGGDAVTGAATVILAMGAGRTAAANIHRYLREKPEDTER